MIRAIPQAIRTAKTIIIGHAQPVVHSRISIGVMIDPFLMYRIPLYFNYIERAEINAVTRDISLTQKLKYGIFA